LTHVTELAAVITMSGGNARLRISVVIVGGTDGDAVVVGAAEGVAVGVAVVATVGSTVGAGVGLAVGEEEGVALGEAEGEAGAVGAGVEGETGGEAVAFTSAFGGVGETVGASALPQAPRSIARPRSGASRITVRLPLALQRAPR
jgi:hypothetical protein